MDTNILCSLGQLANHELLAQVKRLAEREREATAALIAHLAELDARRLYLADGCASLFTFCTQVLHLSEYAACGRIEAARAVRRYPLLLEPLAEGSVTLTTVALVAAHLTPENHRELLEMARHRSKREVEELVARLRPQPPVPASVRKLPSPHHPTVQPTTPAEAAASPDRAGTGPGVPALALSAPAIPPPPARPAVVAPLAPERCRVQFTATADTYAKLRLAQDLLRHQIPDGDLGTVLDRALTALVQELARKKLAATGRPRGGGPVARSGPSYVLGRSGGLDVSGGGSSHAPERTGEGRKAAGAGPAEPNVWYTPAEVRRMPASKVTEQNVFDGMADVFQRYGYDGASLSLLSKATGLERASLYHRFPNGKEQMADALLARIDEWFRRNVFEPLAGPGDPAVRVRRVARRLRELYRRGTRSCVLETLSLGGSTPRIRNHLHRTFAAWLGAFVAIARESGLPNPLARRRAMEALVRIQGSLVVGRVLGDEGPFLRVLDDLPGKLTIR